jgi:hypothetical protein
MTATYEKIATTTVGTDTNSVTFSSIPATYTDLVLVMQIKSSSSDTIRFRFNSDSGSNYSTTRLSGTGSSAVSDRENNSTITAGSNYGWPTSTLGATTHITQIMNYSNTTTYKTLLTRANQASNGVDACVGLWRSTAAINAVSIATAAYGGSSSVQTGSIFTLYGIKAE